MDTRQRVTRQEFLATVLRSRAVRILSMLFAGVAVAYLALGLWQARNVVALIGVIVGLMILAHAFSYAMSFERRRARLDEASRLARSDRSFDYRGLLWSGIGVAAGNVIAHVSGGRHPGVGLIVATILAIAGSIATAVWRNRRAR